MNAIEHNIRRVDAFQQRHKAPGFVFAVTKKFGDDNGGALVANLSYSAFVTLFPLLLVLVTVLNLVLVSDPSAQRAVLHSALSRFPLIGTDLSANVHRLHRSNIIALGVGILGLLWGSLGFAQSGIYTMSQVWNLPGPQRPNFVKRLARSTSFLGVLALGLLVSTFLAGISAFSASSVVLYAAGTLVSAAVNCAGYFAAFRVLTPARVKSPSLVAGAIVGGIGWTVLQSLGGFVVSHYLKNDSQIYGTFGIVLGLLAWIYLGMELTVYSAEINVVIDRRLWPRSIVQPPLTVADRRSLASQAEQNQRRPEERIEVSFGPGSSSTSD
jgi:YihY family inner membrane protein